MLGVVIGTRRVHEKCGSMREDREWHDDLISSVPAGDPR
jgi:hypothetical protein